MSRDKTDKDEFTLGAQIKKTRKVRGLTQNELSKKLKISTDYISRLEKGERSPSPHLLQAIKDWLTTPQTPEENLVANYGRNPVGSSVAAPWRNQGEQTIIGDQTVTASNGSTAIVSGSGNATATGPGDPLASVRAELSPMEATVLQLIRKRPDRDEILQRFLADLLSKP